MAREWQIAGERGRAADAGYRGECFCSWEHLLEYAHAAALGDAASLLTPRAEHYLG